MYYIYMIRCSDDSIYTGITNDIGKRMKEHYYKTPKAAKYTRARDVICLEALWTASDRSSASKLEYSLKKCSRQQKEDIILNPKLIDEELYKSKVGITLESCL